MSLFKGEWRPEFMISDAGNFFDQCSIAFHQRSSAAIWGDASRPGRNSPAAETVEHVNRIHNQVDIARDGVPRSRFSFGDAMGSASGSAGEATRNRRTVGVDRGGNRGDA